jgi:AraC-like DNA-binding protein
MLGFAGWYDAHDGHTTFMFYVPWNLVLFIGPVIYFYFRSLTNDAFRPSCRQFLFLAPGTLLLLAYLWAFMKDIVIDHWWRGQPLTGFYGTRGPNAQTGLPVLDTAWFELLWLYFFLGLTIREYRQYRRYLRDNFSNTEPLEFGWLRNLLVALTAGIAIVTLFSLVNDWLFELSYQQFWFSYFSVAVLIYYLSIAGYSTVRLPVRPQFNPDTPSEPVLAPDPELEEWKRRIERYLAEQRPYLNSNLTLQEMAQDLDTNPSVLSRAINQGFRQNFNELINAYRVGAVKERLGKPDSQQYTLLAIALDCGFNSKATFNRAFRKHTGRSPSEYLRDQGAK